MGGYDVADTVLLELEKEVNKLKGNRVFPSFEEINDTNRHSLWGIIVTKYPNYISETLCLLSESEYEIVTLGLGNKRGRYDVIFHKAYLEGLYENGIFEAYDLLRGYFDHKFSISESGTFVHLHLEGKGSGYMIDPASELFLKAGYNLHEFVTSNFLASKSELFNPVWLLTGGYMISPYLEKYTEYWNSNLCCDDYRTVKVSEQLAIHFYEYGILPHDLHSSNLMISDFEPLQFKIIDTEVYVLGYDWVFSGYSEEAVATDVAQRITGYSTRYVGEMFCYVKDLDRINEYLVEQGREPISTEDMVTYFNAEYYVDEQNNLVGLSTAEKAEFILSVINEGKNT